MISREPKICSNQLLSLPVRTSLEVTHPLVMKAEEALNVVVGADEVTAGAIVAAEAGTIKTALEGDVEATTEVASIAKGRVCLAALASWVLKEATPVWEAAPKMEHSTNHGNQCVSTLTMMILLSSMVKVKD